MAIRTTSLVAVVVALSYAISLYAQTNPTPYDLSSGDYTLSSWDANNSPGTYPPNMVFHVFSRPDNNLQPDTSQVVGNYTGAYNATSGTRINGLGTDGFAFQNTASPGNLGAAVLALNTLGRVNIRVSWKAGTLSSTFTGFRHYSILLQFRVGTSGAWQTAIIGTDTVQYNANIQGNSVVAETVTMPTFTLPPSCENQPVVQIRWRYYQRFPQTTGNRPALKVDDIVVQSDANTGIPTKLAITSIVPSTPSRTAPFSVVIQAQNNDGQPRGVQANTDVVLELVSGTGTLGGTLAATIPAGTHTITISGVTYSTAEANIQIRVRRTAGDNLTSGVSAPFTVMPNATQLTVENFPTTVFATLTLPAFTVTARRADGSVDTHFPYNCSIVVQSGPGMPSGTITVLHTNGIALFNSVRFQAPGNYTIVFTANNLTSSSLTLTVIPHPTIAELIIPQYMISSNASTRIPVWALIRLDNLLPNTTYRYYVGADSISQVTATIGAGNNLHYNANTQTFNYTTTRDFNVPDGYSQFRTDPGQTSKTLWINLVPTANVRFTEGNTMYWLVSIRDSNRAIETRMVTTQGTRALYFGSAQNKVSGMVDSASGLPPKSMICLYDDITGTSRPVATAIVQDEGTTVTSAVPFYAAIDNVQGAFATVVPNSISAIRRIEVRDLQSGNLLRSFTDSDGIWGYADTRNPSSGINATSIHTPRIELQTSLAGQSLCIDGQLTIAVFIRGVDSARVELIRDNEPPYTLASSILPGTHTLQLMIPEHLAGSSNTYIRVIDNARPDVYAITGPFTLNIPPRLINQTQGLTLCPGDSVTLTVLASGTNLRYQWEKDGQPLAGATSHQLHLSSVNPRSSGIYRCHVFGGGACSDLITEAITVVVRPVLTITRQPGTIYAGLGKTAQLTIETNVTDPQATYQWYRGSQPIIDNNRITGSRTATLTIRNIQRADYGTNYYCVVTTSCGTVTSDTGIIRFTGIEITFDTSPLIACPGTTVQLEVLAQSTNNSPLRYQWKKDGLTLQESARYNGTTSSRLTITGVSEHDTGMYWCVIYDDQSGEVRETARRHLQLRQPIEILAQSRDSMYCFGDTLSMSIVLSAAPLSIIVVLPDTAVAFTAPPSNFVLRIGPGYDSSRIRGTYRFRIVTECDTLDSEPFSISFKPLPRIIAHPRSEVQLLEGSTLVLTIEAEGMPGEQLRYRWYKDGEPLPDSIATGPILTIPNVTVSARGRYTCVVYGSCGDSILSRVSTVDILSSISEGIAMRPIIYPQPASDVLIILNAGHCTSATISDVLGRILDSQRFNEPTAGDRRTLNVQQLPTGVYRLNLYRNGILVATQQFIIQR